MDRPIFRYAEMWKKNGHTCQIEYGISKLDILFLSITIGILYKAWEERQAGSSMYEFMKNEFKDLLMFIREGAIAFAHGSAGGGSSGTTIQETISNPMTMIMTGAFSLSGLIFAMGVPQFTDWWSSLSASEKKEAKEKGGDFDERLLDNTIVGVIPSDVRDAAQSVGLDLSWTCEQMLLNCEGRIYNPAWAGQTPLYRANVSKVYDWYKGEYKRINGKDWVEPS